MTVSSHYPTPDYVAGIFHYRAVGNYDKMREYITKDSVHETVGGHSFSGSGGLDYAASNSAQLDGLLDPSKPSKTEVVGVVGGGVRRGLVSI